jgi:hypothetical protein
MKKPMEMQLQVILKESSMDMLAKMMISYVYHMPKGGQNYYEKIAVVIEFLEQSLPSHAGAFAMYFKILDLMPATVKRVIPDGFNEFIKENWDEIEKYYEGPIPEKFRPKNMPKKSGIVDALGGPISSTTPKKLVLV